MNCLVHHTLLIPPSLLHSHLLPPSLPPSPPHLQAGVALVLQQDLNHTHVALVHGHVERRLLALVPGIEVHHVPGQEVDNVWLIPKAGMVDRPVPILVLRGGGGEGGRERGREGRREGGRKEGGREGEREGERREKGGRRGGKEGGRKEGGREGGREGGEGGRKEGGREGERERERREEGREGGREKRGRKGGREGGKEEREGERREEGRERGRERVLSLQVQHFCFLQCAPWYRYPCLALLLVQNPQSSYDI